MTLDFWNTLLHDPAPGSDRHRARRLADFAAILEAAGLTVTAAALARGYAASGRWLEALWADHQDAGPDAHVRAILDGADPGLAARVPPGLFAALVEAYGRPALLDPPRVDPDAATALAALAGRGLVLAVVSNAMRTPGRVLRELLLGAGLLGYFARATFSDEAGVRKPDPRIFALTLDALGVEARAAVHVGDDPVLDVVGARRAGLRVVQVGRAPDRRPGGLAGPAGPRGPRADGQSPDALIASLAELPAAIAELEASQAAWLEAREVAELED